MELGRALNHLQYSEECPPDVHPGRWKGMKKWVEKRPDLKEPIGKLELTPPSEVSASQEQNHDSGNAAEDQGG